MTPQTKLALDQYFRTLGQLYGLPGPLEIGCKYNVSPNAQQTLETRLQESSDFLRRINNVPVNELMGEKLGLGIGSPIASTTDTTQHDRQPIDPTIMDQLGYICTKTDFDSLVRYDKLDMWAKFADFQARMRDAILQRTALDVMTVGFNGISRAANSDRAANPMLQDVNVGWLQKIRVNAPHRVLNEVADGSGEIQVGNSATAQTGYKTLDAVVVDAVENMLDPWYREDTQLVAVVGRKLMHDKYFPLINSAMAPTERLAMDALVSQMRVGNLTAMRVPGFPPDAVLVTRLDNLSRYYQTGGRRRTIVDNPKRDQIENYESSNDAYVVEDHGGACLIENITLVA